MILKQTNLNIRASAAEKAMLEQVAQANETTPSEMMRQLIRQAHAQLGKQENPMINKDEIIDRVGGANWQDVVSEFSGQGESEVKATLDYMYPHEDNQELAQAIAEKVNQ